MFSTYLRAITLDCNFFDAGQIVYCKGDRHVTEFIEWLILGVYNKYCEDHELLILPPASTYYSVPRFNYMSVYITVKYGESQANSSSRLVTWGLR